MLLITSEEVIKWMTKTKAEVRSEDRASNGGCNGDGGVDINEVSSSMMMMNISSTSTSTFFGTFLVQALLLVERYAPRTS